MPARPLGLLAVVLGIGFVSFPEDAWSQAGRPPANVQEAIALTDINLVAGTPVIVALVEDKTCRLAGKIGFQQPIDNANPRLVTRGGWTLSFSSMSCTQPDGSVHQRPFVGGTDLPSALKRGDRVTVTGIDHAR